MRTYRIAPILLVPLLGASPVPKPPLCPPIEGLSSVVETAKGKFIVFGELHGTAQSPELFGTVACHLAKKYKQLLVAIELSSTDNDGLQVAWSGPHAGFAERLLVAMPEWNDRTDGVTSRAMLAMLQDLHRLKAEGARIDIVAFNGARDEAQRMRWKHLKGQGPHEAAQAENIRSAAGRGTYDHVLVLVGNFHAREVTVRSRTDEFEPMAMRLGSREDVLTLNMAYGAGTSWTCQAKGQPGKPITPADIECTAYSTRGNADADGPPRIGLGVPPGAGMKDEWALYDGYFWTGAISASPPVTAEPGKEPQ